jgi:hypothetical protein
MYIHYRSRRVMKVLLNYLAFQSFDLERTWFCSHSELIGLCSYCLMQLANRKTTERGKIDTYNTYMYIHYRSLSWIVTGIWIKNDGLW